MSVEKIVRGAALVVLLAFAAAFAAAVINRFYIQIDPGAAMFRSTDQGTEICTARDEPLFGPVTCISWVQQYNL